MLYDTILYTIYQQYKILCTSCYILYSVHYDMLHTFTILYYTTLCFCFCERGNVDAITTYTMLHYTLLYYGILSYTLQYNTILY